MAFMALMYITGKWQRQNSDKQRCNFQRRRNVISHLESVDTHVEVKLIDNDSDRHDRAELAGTQLIEQRDD